jgi:hypothetical protein
MVVWNSFTAHSISRAKADLAQIAAENTEVENASRTFAEFKSRISELQKKAALVQEIDSRIDVASVLAELSFLIDKRIVLSRVELTAEKFSHEHPQKKLKRAGARPAGGKSGAEQALPLGDVKFKLVIGGVAADAGDVAALICKLEDSPYFSQVVPLFSRNTQIKPDASLSRTSVDSDIPTPGAQRTLRASEFEISCYLANYRQL